MQLTAAKRSPAALEAVGFLKGAWFAGRSVTCPCCGWRLRTFTSAASGFDPSDDGYCPRCFSKARHRRVWMELEELAGTGGRVLQVAPRWAVLRSLRKLPGVEVNAIDVEPGLPGVEAVDLARTPFADGTFDGVVCVHVLEHMDEDEAALDELGRIVACGGWLLLSVPLMLDQPTYEDRTITDPAARREAFGEPDHWRIYGVDLMDRVAERGFDVALLDANELDPRTVRRYGLRRDEHVLLCRKPSR